MRKNGPPCSTAVQSSLRPDEVVVEYVLSEPRSYCVWISKKRAAVKALPAGRQQIEELTRKYLDEMRAKRDDISLAQQIYSVLLSPLPQETSGERLVVVPDGILNLLPFDTLHDLTGSLLLENRTISYVPASTVLNVLRNMKEMQPSRRAFLGVGDVPYQNQGRVSAKVEKPTGAKQRLLRGLSDTFGSSLYDLPHWSWKKNAWTWRSSANR
jgi:CHAT domain-containing protein